MPRQEEHDEPQNLVERPHKSEHSARSLQEAADSNATLEGYYAINQEKPPEEIEQAAEDDKLLDDREKGDPGP